MLCNPVHSLQAIALEVNAMIKLPFQRKPKDGGSEKPSVAFADYCNSELERRRDSGTGLDEERFRAAVELAVGRLRGMEEGEA